MSDIIYYNVIMNGINPATQSNISTSALAYYNETRLVPFISNPSEYYMAIVRFSIDGSALPLFVCPVIYNPNNPSDINFTPFVISLSYSGMLYSMNLEYMPNDNSEPLPPAPTPTIPQGNLSTNYYYVYYITTFLLMLNNALYSAFTKLIIAVPALASYPAPYFVYDSVSELISLVVPNFSIGGGPNVYLTQYDYGATQKPLYGASQPAGTIQILVNSYLYSYLEGLKAFVIIQSGTQPNFLFLIDDLYNNYYYPPQNDVNTSPPQIETSFSTTSGGVTSTFTAKPEYFIFSQQYLTFGAYNSVSSIVILCNLPIQNEYIPSFTNNPNNNIGSSFRNVLTDYVIDPSLLGGQRNKLVYIPSVYRFIVLNSFDPISRIQLQIYWADNEQNLYPMRVTNGRSNSLKLMFIKKSLLKNQSGYNMLNK